MTDQIVNLVTQIFSYVFLVYQAFFAFYNSANHVYFIKNTFLAKKINLNISEK